MSDTAFNINASVHPEYTYNSADWEKFQYVWDGGERFREQYLRSYSSREHPPDFVTRKEISPIPCFATAAVTDIKNSIFQRMGEITRVGGSESFQDVMSGQQGGVNLHGANINYFIGEHVLPELLFMGKVGVFVDMPVINGVTTLDQTKNKHPYYYKYGVADIRNWRYAKHDEYFVYDMLLLRERVLTYDDIYHLPVKDTTRFRLLTREDGVVLVRFFDEAGTQVDLDGEPTAKPLELDIKHIPFHVFELRQSLLQNIADHQIALLNLESSDVSYALLSNYAFYIEQTSPMQSPHLKQEKSEFSSKDDLEIEVGGSTGRSYGKGLNPPSFINPSTDPLNASMLKQEHLKADIRTLVQLSLSNLQPKFASAEAKQFDEHGLESGLSNIGLILEHGERQLTMFWNEYERKNDIATINYPERYALKSDMERLVEAEKLYEMMLRTPSTTAQKSISKLIAGKLLDAKISRDDLVAVYAEIDAAAYVTTEPAIIHADLEKGLVGEMTASKARGYKAEVEVPQAKHDHAERTRRIMVAQSSIDGDARGVEDLSIDDNSAQDEKRQSQNPDIQGDNKKPVRGEA